MRHHLTLLFTVFLVWTVGCSATKPTNDEGWQSIFNGRDLTGWSVRCKPADANHTFWKVDDGTILADSIGKKDHNYVWLATQKEYDNFVLRLKFQAYRDSPGNSGVQIRSRYDEQAGYLDGPQVDIHPPGPWRTGMIWDETRGSQHWLSPNVPKGKWVDATMAAPGLTFFYSYETPAWNDLEIAAIGPRIRVRLNGLLVTDYDGTGVLDNPVHRQHQVGTRGVIALQIHNLDELRIRFKDLQIRETSPENNP